MRNLCESHLLTAREVSRLLNCSLSFVYARAADGSLAHYQLGGAVRFSEKMVSDYLSLRERRGRPTQVGRHGI